MTQQVQYVVDLKGAQEAQRELDRLGKSMDNGAASAVKLGTQLERVEAHTARAAGGTRNMGQAALEASRGLEDLQYGIGGVVNNIPSLVMAFGGGAGLTAAISLGAVAINQLVKNFGEVGDAGAAGADAAAAHMDSLKKSIQDADDEMQNLVLGAGIARIKAQEMTVAEAANAGKKAQDAFRASFGVDPNDERSMGRIASQAQGGLDIWVEKWNAQKQEMEKVRVAAKDVMGEYRKVTDAFNMAIDEQILLKRYEGIEAERVEQLKTDAAVDAANDQEKAYKDAADKRAKDAEKEREKNDKLKYDVFVAGLEAEDKAMREVNKARAADAKKDESDRLKAQKDADRAREKQNKKTLDAIAKAERAHAEQQAQYATQAVGIVAGASTQLISDMVSGQEHALERFGLSIMAQAGQALVSYGIQAIGRGVLEASSPLTAALAPASFAAGAALVGSGVALGGVAGGLSGLMGSAGGDGDTKRSTRDPGASPRRGSGGSDGGGPVVLNLTYGAAGPLPEDTARLISRELRTGAKRAGR